MLLYYMYNIFATSFIRQHNVNVLNLQEAHPYNFAYAVKDDYYNDYSQQESSDGKVVAGSYQVLLPDGRVQHVNYKADDYTGYVADVTYKGEAKTYDYKPAYKAAAYPAPAYKAPAYPAKY